MPAAAALLPKPPRRDEDIGVVFPHNIEAERCTLGAALINANAADYIVDNLSTQAYHRRAHQWLFEAIRSLRERQVAPDLVTLQQELRRAKRLEDVGGPVYISQLTDGMPASSNVMHYAGILQDLSAKRALVHYANQTLDLVAAGEHGAQTMLEDADRRLIDLQLGHVAGRMMSLRESHKALMDDLEWRVAHRGELTGVDTGFASVNELTLGWQPGDVVVIAARPSIGKTTFVMNSAAAGAASLRADGSKRRVAVFSLEMRRKQLEYRMLSSLSQIMLTRLLTGTLMAQEYERLSTAMESMTNLDIEVDDRGGQSVWEMRSACRRMKVEGGLDLVIIDYVQLVPGSIDRRGASRNDEVTDISRRLKALADEVAVPILLLSQLSRANEKRNDPRPKLSDLRESGALEQDADIVGFLHRKNHREGGLTQLIIEKQRNGPTGTVNLTLDRDTVTFTDGGEEPPAPEPATEPKKKKKVRVG